VSLLQVPKLALKRGALVAAANWRVTLIQALADSLSKLVIAAPLVAGTMLVALVVGAEPGTLLTLEPRELAATILALLLSRPLVLTAFAAAMAVAVIGASLFVFLVKGGTVAVLVRGERVATDLEQPPLRPERLSEASVFSIELFTQSATALFPRYARLGAVLMSVYLASGAAYVTLLFARTRLGDGLAITFLLTVGFVGWITVVNFLYLLVQVVIAADDCSVLTAAKRVVAFLRASRWSVVGVFLAILALVVFATIASLLATAALGLVAFVPLIGLAVLPLQLLAWLLRSLVFQYIALTSVGAYLKLYREFTGEPATQLKQAPSYPVLGTTTG
jgi:hypothetical protein